MPNPGKQPVYYIPHGGGPCFFMDWTIGPADTWHKMAAWLSGMAAELQAKPAAWLVVSAHWEAEVPTVTAADNPALIYDYHGFPAETYRLTYPVPGSPSLAGDVLQLLSAEGIQSTASTARGLDHGAFIPFKLISPEATIPLVQLSLQRELNADFHYRIGRALAPLRDQGVCIVGSGFSSHNLAAMMQPDSIMPGSADFNDWLVNSCGRPEADRRRRLANWLGAPAARLVHPREEHLIPVMVAAGAALDDPGECVFRDVVLGATAVAIRFG